MATSSCPTGIRIRNVRVENATESFADIRNCRDVRIDGLELGKGEDK